MLNFFTKRLNRKNKKGFTLVELIVVIAIVAVLAAVGIPAIAGYVGKSKLASLTSNAKLVATQGQTMISSLEAAGQTITDTTPTDTDIIKAAGIDSAKFDIVITRKAVDENGIVAGAAGHDSTKVVSYVIDTVTCVDKGKTAGTDPTGKFTRS